MNNTLLRVYASLYWQYIFIERLQRNTDTPYSNTEDQRASHGVQYDIKLCDNICHHREPPGHMSRYSICDDHTSPDTVKVLLQRGLIL